jgi:hypothetical protein
MMSGWEPRPVPGRTLDEPMPPPTLKVLGPEPPSLCRQGPCSHYHELSVRLDASTPMDGSSDVMHTQLTRSCYPTSGIQIELDDTPVFACSRWSPDTTRQYQIDAMQRDYNLSNAGVKYYRELSEWKADQARIAAEVKTYAELKIETKTVLELLASQMDVGDELQIRLRATGDVMSSVMRLDGVDTDPPLARVTAALPPASYQLRVLGADRETIKATSRYDHERPTAPKETP